MSYIRLFLHTQSETYHLYLGISALDRLEINLSALEKLENWSVPEGNLSSAQEQACIRIFDNKNNEVVIVGEGQANPLPEWLREWLEERGYHLPADGMLKTISEKEFTKALNDTEIYYFGRNNFIKEEA